MRGSVSHSVLSQPLFIDSWISAVLDRYKPSQLRQALETELCRSARGSFLHRWSRPIRGGSTREILMGSRLH